MCVSVSTLRLTVEQKCNIATRELDELREDRQRKEEEFERSSDNHRVGSYNRTVDVHLDIIVDKVGASLVPRPPFCCVLVCNQWTQTKEQNWEAWGQGYRYTVNRQTLSASANKLYNTPLGVSFSLQAVIGEADLKLQELKKLQYEFERDIVRGAINPVNQIPRSDYRNGGLE